MSEETTQSVDDHVLALERDGYAVVPEALDADLLADLVSTVESVKEGAGVRSRNGIYAIRNLLHLAPGVKRALESTGRQGTSLNRHWEPEAFLAGGLYFDKHPDANWKVPWNQDSTITVRENADVTGFGPWTMKAGIQHVQAPPFVLYDLLTLRLHLDGCDEATRRTARDSGFSQLRKAAQPIAFPSSREALTRLAAFRKVACWP